MRTLIAIIVLMTGTALSVFAQATEKISLDIPADPLFPDQSFTISMQFPEEGIAEPQITIPSISSRVSLVSGPVISRGPGVDSNGKRGSFVVIKYSLRTYLPGYVVFPPFTVQYGSHNYRTETAVLGIMVSPTSRYVPPDLVWNIHAPSVHEGQVVLVTLDLRYATSIVFPQKIDVTMPSGAKTEEVTGLGQIENERIAGRDFSRVPLSAWELTPLVSGSIVLPVVRMNYQDTVLVAPAKTIELVSLPPELSGTGAAIGTVQFRTFLGKTQAAQNEQILLTVRLEGEGNLNLVHLPTPTFSDLQILGSSDNSKFVPAESGYRGFRETVYRLSAPTAGSRQIGIPVFQWLGLDGIVHTVPATTLSLSILSPDQISDSQSPHDFHMLSADEIWSLRPLYLYNRIEGVLALLPGVALWLFAAIRRIFGKPRPKNRGAGVSGKLLLALVVLASVSTGTVRLVADSRTDINSAIGLGLSAYQRHDFQEASRQFDLARSLDPKSPGILYDLALAGHGKNSDAQALFNLQLALRLVPGNDLIRSAMLSVEKSLGVEHQLKIVPLPSADLLYLIVAACLALSGLIVCFRGWKARMASLFLFLFVILFGTTALGVFLYTRVQATSDVGVVSEAGASMRKIPDRGAPGWLNVSAGTTLRLIAASDNFTLVETAYGIKGWIETGVLYHAQP